MRLDKWIKTTLALLMAAVGLHGCDRLHDDMSMCDLFLQFRYDYNLSDEDWFSQQVEEVRVFVFDTDGGYVSTLKESGAALAVAGYKMPVPYAFKGYTMVVWAGRVEADYVVPRLAVGDPVEKLTLRYQPQNNTSDRHIAPLWHSGPHKMTFLDDGQTTQTVNLLRDTNDIEVAVTKTDGTAANAADYDIRITGANAAYSHRNAFISGSPEIAYLPVAYTERAAQLYTMRLVKDTHLDLTVTERASGRPIMANGKAQINLNEFLAKSKPEAMDDQEYLDRRYIWEVRLGFDGQSFLAVSITINGWTYWFQSTEL